MDDITVCENCLLVYGLINKCPHCNHINPGSLKTLLIKYIQYIRGCEGTDFISPIDERWFSDVKFTDDEWELLKILAAEANDA